jgi:hypothetical protein
MKLIQVLATALVGLLSIQVDAQQQLKVQQDCKGQKRPFASVRALDQRTHDVIGVIQKGAFNRAVRLEVEGALAPQLAAFFGSDTSALNAQPESVLVLQDFFLTERTGGMDETGYFKLNCSVYVLNGDRYYEAMRIDSTYQVSALDVTKKLMRFVSEQFCALSSEVAMKLRGGPPDMAATYTLNEVARIDSLEKQSLPAYTVTAMKPGIYRTYDEFKNNRPQDVPLRVEPLGRDDYAVYDLSKKKGGTRIPLGQAYAVVSNGQMLKGTVRGFYPMQLLNGNYYFYGYSSAYEVPNGSVGGLLLAGALGGVIGSSIYMANATNHSPLKQKSKYGYDLFRINHRSGKVILVSQ